jgi:hypothetical protein
MNQDQQDDSKVGWRPAEWGRAVGLSRASVFNLLAAGAINSVKYSSRATIITTAPRDYLASLTEDAAATSPAA